MPLTRIKQTAIGNDSITTPKLDDTTGDLDGDFVRVPVEQLHSVHLILLVDR